MSEENLKACAHCGNDADLGKGHLGYYVVCRCISPKKTREEIIQAWNTRQSPDVEGAIEEIGGIWSIFQKLKDDIEYHGNSSYAYEQLDEKLTTIKNKLQGSQS